MKTAILTFLLTLTCTLTSCLAVPVDTLATDEALGRQIQRVIDRHDAYVAGSLHSERAAAESAALDALLWLPAVPRAALRVALEPVADRHDAYVAGDPALDDLERATYLASTDGLRRLVGLREPE